MAEGYSQSSSSRRSPSTAIPHDIIGPSRITNVKIWLGLTANAQPK